MNVNLERNGIKQIDSGELYELYQEIQKGEGKKEVVLLDVREEHEYVTGHIPGAYLLPVSQFQARFLKELSPDKEYVVICQSGQRSLMVCMFLKEQGFEHCINFTPGMSGWHGPIERGFPSSSNQKKND